MNKKSKNIFIKNFTNLSLNQGINIITAIVVTPILFQNLGESQFGLVNLAFSLFMLISITVSYGYHLNGPKQISLLTKPNQEARCNKRYSFFKTIYCSNFIAINFSYNLFN